MLSFSFSFARIALLVGLVWGTMGCGVGEGERENRTPEFSPDGKAVGFQHGRDGLFVWDEESGRAEQIYLPSKEVIAVSTPLWSPDGERLVFATAFLDPAKSSGQSETAAPVPDAAWDANPSGRQFPESPAFYDCWLCERGPDRKISPPRKLFQAETNHVGMVAANFAVRWHPAGDRLLFIDRSQGDSQQVREFDLKNSRSQSAVPFEAKNLLFDWTPGGERLVCVLQDSKTPERNGIWIGRPGESRWWQVPFSNHTVRKSGGDPLSRLRRLRPVWSRDGKQFAFVAPPSREDREASSTKVLHLGEWETQTTRELYRVRGSLRDLHWSPDGKSIGYLLGTEELKKLRGMRLSLQISDCLMVQKVSESSPVPVTLRPVRNFAGWNNEGTSLAYTVPDPYGPKAEPCWAFLLLPIEAARDRVVIADAAGLHAERDVFTGMRANFLNWSPQREKLALWATFSPSHAVLPLSNLGLRPGDPAAILNVQTGEMNWMPINTYEKVQIGHSALQRKNYAEARRWYEEAQAEFAAREKGKKTSAPRELFGPERFEMFHAYCLEKLGETEAARKKRREFFALTAFEAETNAGDLQTLAPLIAESHAIARQLYLAQIFLSLNAVEDGLAFFAEEPQVLPGLVSAKALAHEQFAAKVAQAQLLLNVERWDEFARLATKELVPMLLKRNLSSCDSRSIVELSSQAPAISAGGYCLLPLMAEDFTNQLSTETIEELIPAWEAFRLQTESQVALLWIDRFLQLAYQRMSLDEAAQAARKRYESNPQKSKYEFEAAFQSDLFDIRKQLQLWDALKSL